MCEIRSKDKITAGELLSVQCLRLLEQNKINDKHQAIELSASELEYDTNGHLVRPERFLARRAELLLPNYHLRAEIFSKMFWGFILSGIVLILFLGLCVIPFAKSDNILGGTTTNLAGPFFFFIVLQLFFLFLSVSLLLLSGIFYIFIRLFKGKKTADKFSGKMNWFSATLGTVLLYLIRGLDHCRRKLSPIYGKIYRLSVRPQKADFLFERILFAPVLVCCFSFTSVLSADEHAENDLSLSLGIIDHFY